MRSMPSCRVRHGLSRFFLSSVLLLPFAATFAQAGGDACCLPEGGCIETDAKDCATQGGDYQGFETSCKTPGVCTPAECGDEIVEKPEECDDGNTGNGDGCDEYCLKEPVCGDKKLDVGEECDDGNNASGDGCTDVCVIEFCGDGIVNDDPPILNLRHVPIAEECDDGNTVSGDGCDEYCKEEPEYGACCFTGDCHVKTKALCDQYGGVYQGDDTNCEDAGICAACGDGLLQSGEGCDDGNAATGDGCDDLCAVEGCWTCDEGSPSVCTLDDGQACDDGDQCTLGDACEDGLCEGVPPIIPAACRWVMVGGDDQREVQSRTRDLVKIIGDICGETTRVGESDEITGDVVATATSGLGSSIYAFASIDGDVLTGGGSISGKPNGTLLPDSLLFEVASGSMSAQATNADAVFDARGGANTDPRVYECEDAIDGIDPSTDLLDALPQSQSLGDVRIQNNQSLTIVASNPGGLNVIDITRITTGNKTTLVLDGQGDPDTVFVLRVQRKLYLRFQSELQLTGGTTPEHVILYGKGLCKMGEDVIGGGTIFCPNGKLKMEENTRWGGALISGRKFINLRHKSELTHVPLLVGAP